MSPKYELVVRYDKFDSHHCVRIVSICDELSTSIRSRIETQIVINHHQFALEHFLQFLCYNAKENSIVLRFEKKRVFVRIEKSLDSIFEQTLFDTIFISNERMSRRVVMAAFISIFRSDRLNSFCVISTNKRTNNSSPFLDQQLFIHFKVV